MFADVGDQVITGLREFGVAVVMLAVLCVSIFFCVWWTARNVVVPVRDAAIEFLRKMASAQEDLVKSEHRQTAVLEQTRLETAKIGDLIGRLDGLSSKVDSLARRMTEKHKDPQT